MEFDFDLKTCGTGNASVQPTILDPIHRSGLRYNVNANACDLPA
jgi:hypothetical protein